MGKVAAMQHGMSEERVDWNLWNWARHMRATRESGLDYPSRASGGLENYRSGGDDEAEYEQCCKDWAATTDAAIDDLPATNKQAVYAVHLDGPWLLPEIARGLYYRDSIGLLARELSRRGIE